MNAPLANALPLSLLDKVIYYVEVEEEAHYNEETEEYEDETTVKAGLVIGISTDDAGTFYFLVETGDDREFETWDAIHCRMEKPEGLE